MDDDFGCVRSADMYNELLKKQVHYFKETKGGRAKMCEIVENAAEKIAARKAIEIANKKNDIFLVEKIKVVMIKLHDTAEVAMDFLDIPKDKWGYYKSLL